MTAADAVQRLPVGYVLPHVTKADGGPVQPRCDHYLRSGLDLLECPQLAVWTLADPDPTLFACHHHRDWLQRQPRVCRVGPS